jgi:streptomycin 6-kinase
MPILFAVFITAAVALAVVAAIVATRRLGAALLQFAPAFASLAAAWMLPGHRNVPAVAALLAVCAALLTAAGRVHLRNKRAAAHG